jgi:hypothetical protein
MSSLIMLLHAGVAWPVSNSERREGLLWVKRVDLTSRRSLPFFPMNRHRRHRSARLKGAKMGPQPARSPSRLYLQELPSANYQSPLSSCAYLPI